MIQRIRSQQSRQGLKRVELLVVIVIIATLLGLLLPATRRVHVDSTGSQVIYNLKQLGVACHMYHDQYRKLPPAYGTVPYVLGAASPGSSAYGSALAILAPYYERNTYILIPPTDYSWTGTQGAFPTSTAPARAGPVYTGIAANYWVFGTLNDSDGSTATVPNDYIGAPKGGGPGFHFTPLALKEIRDGTSNTMLVRDDLCRPDPHARRRAGLHGGVRPERHRGEHEFAGVPGQCQRAVLLAALVRHCPIPGGIQHGQQRRNQPLCRLQRGPAFRCLYGVGHPGRPG